jgi:hypothetical protein
MSKIALVLCLLLAACAPVAVAPTDLPTVTPDPTSTLLPTSIPAYIAPLVEPVAEVAPTSAPEPTRTNWLLLGGDYREHREGTGWGNKTDVMVLVSILQSDPVEITVVQFPRNLYVPSSLGDTWMFAVWGQSGWDGLRTYFDEVFGIELTGIFYINMDSFVTLVDGLGGLVPWGLDRIDHSGEGILEYLRDNENNWGGTTYDQQQRVFGVLIALLNTLADRIKDEPVMTMKLLLENYGDLIESDLSTPEQFYWLAIVGGGILRNYNYVDRLIQLEQPYVIRGDTPIIQDGEPMRGLIAGRDWNIPDGPAGLSDPQILTIWMNVCAFGNGCE